MKKILVIGESCRDVFVYCDAFRLCPDVPVPVLNIKDQIDNPGMSKNVHRNIQSLINTCDIITNYDWYDITKTRYVHENSNHMFFRVDSPHKISRIDVSKIDYDYEIIVISDYDKGFLHSEDIEEICSKHSNVFIDTKKILGDWVKNAKFIKINDYEYQRSKTFIDQNKTLKIIRTMGADGCEYNNKRYLVDRVEVKDVSGAGDSFLSGLVVNYYKTNDIEQSINFANKCASKVVKQRGVTVI
jgi:D-beta-D-heptose 7-phosphate kinase/D-beta-D-heptose 1-phosphate adenosyltransferase